jgi:hypothetical protein
MIDQREIDFLNDESRWPSTFGGVRMCHLKQPWLTPPAYGVVIKEGHRFRVYIANVGLTNLEKDELYDTAEELLGDWMID